jgi:hypothetical protein
MPVRSSPTVAPDPQTPSALSRERGDRGQRASLATRDVALRLFATCWLIFVVHFATNTVREVYPALSLGDHLSFDVSEYLGLHPDIFALAGRGAFIDNNPGASMMGALPYALVRPVIDVVSQRVAEMRAGSNAPTPEYQSPWPMAREFYQIAYQRGLDVKFALGAAVMQAFLMAPISALSVVVMFLVLLHLTSSVRSSAFLALLYAFATPVLYRTAQLNHNLLLAHAGFFAFTLLWYPWNPDAGRKLRFGLAGLLCGWCVVLDYSGVVVLCVLGLYAVVLSLGWPPRLRVPIELLVFGVGVVGSLSVLAVYQWQAFGSPLVPAQHMMPPTPYSNYGYNGMGWPQLDLLWDTTFGPRFGLFTSAPLLVLAVVPVAWGRKWSLIGRREILCVAAMSVVFCLFAAGNQFGRLQFNSGVRYVVPIVPFAFLVVAGAMRAMPRPLAIAAALAGTYWSWTLAMYRDVELGAGIVESPIHITLGGPQLPWMTTLEELGYLPQGTSPIPIFLVCAAAIWIIWRIGRTTAGIPQPDRNDS